jgi:TldD protein
MSVFPAHPARVQLGLEDGIVKEGSHNIEQGVGVRAMSARKTGFAYSDEIVLPALLEAAGSARAIARSGARTAPWRIARARCTGRCTRPIDPIDSAVPVRTRSPC